MVATTCASTREPNQESLKDVSEKATSTDSSQPIFANSTESSGGKIYFVPCAPISSTSDVWVFRNFVHAAFTALKDEKTIPVRSVALPVIGCECSFGVNELLTSAVHELTGGPWSKLDVYFVVPQDQHDAFKAFKRCLTDLITKQRAGVIFSLQRIVPTLKSQCPTNVKRVLDKTTEQAAKVIQHFWRTMQKDLCTEVVKLELIWNERWYKQYHIHAQDFYQRLGKRTERQLFHGCPQHAADKIITEGFNRSYAGTHGEDGNGKKSELSC